MGVIAVLLRNHRLQKEPPIEEYPTEQEGSTRRMAMEPITIYARRIDPRGVVELLRSLDPEVIVVGPDDVWEQATLILHQPGQKNALHLTFRHDPGYYDGNEWSRQMLGMQGFFLQFPDNARKAQVMRMISGFRFALATSWDPDLIPEGDSRLPYLYAVTRHLDGVLFTPSGFRDAEGRILSAADGDFDEDAVFPVLPEPVAGTEDDEDDEEEPDYKVQSSERVAQRALALTAVAVRALLEQEDPNDPTSEEFRQRILNWIDALGIGEELEPDEWEILQRPVGRLERQQQIDATWRLEGLVVLAWALKRIELPPHDQLVSPNELTQAMGFLDEEVSRQILEHPDLRTEEEIEWQAKRLLGLHWRLRDFTLRPMAMDFRAFAANCWFGSFDLTDISLVNDDLALGGVTLSEADEQAFGTAYSLARERHLAINWLQGYSRIYSETDTST